MVADSREARVCLALCVVVAMAVTCVACNPEGTPADRFRTEDGGTRCQVEVVGDSLVVGARDAGGLASELVARGCDVRGVDGRVGRTTAEGASIIEAMARAGTLPSILVVGLGTNDCSAGPFAKDARRILAAAGPDRSVVWINTWRRGCDRAINGVLWSLQVERNAGAEDLGNLWILDHWGWVHDHPGVLAGDRVHLTPDGYRHHADRIAGFVSGL